MIKAQTIPSDAEYSRRRRPYAEITIYGFRVYETGEIQFFGPGIPSNARTERSWETYYSQAPMNPRMNSQLMLDISGIPIRIAPNGTWEAREKKRVQTYFMNLCMTELKNVDDELEKKQKTEQTK
ncbi:hypothetical protein B7494_g446 [Chlorociboria aeruginascens]|nr:hypothetical protein B7494_g446 [Chlorociboria aeruginascens]